MSKFNEDEDRVLVAYQRQLVQMGRNEALKRATEEGEAKGIVKGRKEGLVVGRKEGLVEGRKEELRSQAIKFYQIKFPNEDTRWLENLTKNQYDRILDFLFENKSLDEIKKIIK